MSRTGDWYSDPADDWHSQAAKAPTTKQTAREIYNQLKNNPELQKELNKLLRKEKLKQIENE